MGQVLVVGATGQLGNEAVRMLLAQGTPVRALVRSTQSAARFQALGAEAVPGDLTDPASLREACRGIAAIVATANSSVPSRKSDTFEAVERQGYRNLIEAASSEGVKKFIYTSVMKSDLLERLSAFIRYKRETEQRLLDSKLECTIFRAGVFMDVAFAMMGTTVPVRGTEYATIQRPFPFVAKHLKRIGHSMDSKREVMIPGDGATRHSFICVTDVARFLVAACAAPGGVYDLGGPEALTYRDIVRLYEEILGLQLRVKTTPALVFRALSLVLKPFDPAGANLMALNYCSTVQDTVIDSSAALRDFALPLTTAREFLIEKYRLGATGTAG